MDLGGFRQPLYSSAINSSREGRRGLLPAGFYSDQPSYDMCILRGCQSISSYLGRLVSCRKFSEFGRRRRERRSGEGGDKSQNPGGGGGVGRVKGGEGGGMGISRNQMCGKKGIETWSYGKKRLCFFERGIFNRRRQRLSHISRG